MRQISRSLSDDPYVPAERGFQGVTIKGFMQFWNLANSINSLLVIKSTGPAIVWQGATSKDFLESAKKSSFAVVKVGDRWKMIEFNDKSSKVSQALVSELTSVRSLHSDTVEVSLDRSVGVFESPPNSALQRELGIGKYYIGGDFWIDAKRYGLSWNAWRPPGGISAYTGAMIVGVDARVNTDFNMLTAFLKFSHSTRLAAPFEYTYPELFEISREFRDLTLAQGETVINRLVDSSAKNIEILGFGLNRNTILMWLSLTILGLQLLLMVFTKQLLECIRELGSNWTRYWIGAYNSRIPKLVTVTSIILLPSLVIIWAQVIRKGSLSPTMAAVYITSFSCATLILDYKIFELLKSLRMFQPKSDGATSH